jgi:hypothetical protein
VTGTPEAFAPQSSTVQYSANNQVTIATIAPAGFSYDAAGNVLYDGVSQYAYDGEGRL